MKLKPLIDAYTGPFKDKYRFWTGLCLIFRLILAVVFLMTAQLQSKVNNYIIIISVGTLYIIETRVLVYRNKYLSLLEMTSFGNLILLCITSVLFSDSYPDIVPMSSIVTVSVSVEICLFIVIATGHIYLYFTCKRVLCNSRRVVCSIWCAKLFLPRVRHIGEELPLVHGDLEDSMDSDDKEGLPPYVIKRRESLLFDINVQKENL